MSGLNYFVLLILYKLLFLYMHVRPERYQNSGFGPYQLNMKLIGPCNANELGTNEHQTNFHLSKRNKIMEIVGNLTLLVPWDDYSSVDMHFFKRDSNAGYIPNFLRLEFKGCSAALIPYGDAGKDFFLAMNISSVCPKIEKGTYIQPGYDARKLFIFKNPLVPKSFFYGSYKVLGYSKRKGKIMGCSYIVIDVVPNWLKN